jgi:hypothetical protein
LSSAITFYEVDTDVDRYQYFVIDGDEAWRWGYGGDRFLVANGRPWADAWAPPPVFSFQPRLPEGDFWGILGLGGASMVVRPEALRHGHLEIFLAPAGELLPLPYKGRDFRLLNITECIDALDEANTIWDYPLRDAYILAEIARDEPDRVLTEEEIESSRHVESPRFRLDRLGWQLFKVPETAITQMYYWERSLDGEDEQLRAYCEREGLTGLVFRELYTTDCPW